MMELKETECQHKKTVKNILQSDSYLVITTKGNKVCISYVGSDKLIAGVATAIKTTRDIRAILYHALKTIERGERHK